MLKIRQPINVSIIYRNSLNLTLALFEGIPCDVRLSGDEVDPRSQFILGFAFLTARIQAARHAVSPAVYALSCHRVVYVGIVSLLAVTDTECERSWEAIRCHLCVICKQVEAIHARIA
ncbi:hypothetical protein FGO68_gene590 [Halteria grandinella]|uniref:Uncharacterized protein n=1 Tax=Halteria grandinella TaxID=5974 RepID=A0A8J8P687_HALGN|nr:hypothetical protein FGO68_gene590 [Halteria grandinella]